MFCQKCGQNLSNDAKFCENCGALTLQQPPSPTPQEAIPPQQPQGGYQQGYQQPIQQPTQQPMQQGYQPGVQPQYGYQQPGQTVYPQQPYPIQPSPQKKSKALPIIGIVVLLVVLIIGGIFIAGIVGGGKDIANVQLAASVDTTTNLAIKPTTVFSTDTPVIYCTFKSNLPVGTAISSTWVYLGTEGDSITYDYVTEYDPEQNYFYIGMPDDGWPIGNYEVIFSIKGKEYTKVKFSVK